MIESIRFIKVIVCLLILNLMIDSSVELEACWGARPLSMGGAFTGVADDVNAVYWNPAGLVHWQKSGVTSMFVTDRDAINYDLYLAGAMNLSGDLSLGFPATLAVAYTLNQDPDYLYSVRNAPEGRYESRVNNRANEFFHLAGGMFLYTDDSGYYDLAGGLILKALTKQFTVEEWFYDNNLYKWQRLRRKTYSDYEYDFDLGFLARWGKEMGEPGESAKMFSLGVLVQNINKCVLLGEEWITNYRPGFGFRPYPNVLLSLELYDAAKECFDKVQLRYGGEIWFNHPYTSQKFIALRGGVYHANEPTMKAYTYGLGLRWPVGYLSKGKAKQFIDLDYGRMDWTESGESTELISLGLRF
jgi:hypothetical protein